MLLMLRLLLAGRRPTQGEVLEPEDVILTHGCERLVEVAIDEVAIDEVALSAHRRPRITARRRRLAHRTLSCCSDAGTQRLCIVVRIRVWGHGCCDTRNRAAAKAAKAGAAQCRVRSRCA